jgi:peroxiredoxin Q/BCP
MKTFRHFLCWVSTAVLAAALTLWAAPPPAPEGMIAPLFSALDQDGNHWKLSDHVGKGVVFLYFFPKADTADSSAEACSLRDNLFELKQKGVEVVGVSFDDKKVQKEFIFKYNLDFPLLTDADGAIADAYGTRMDSHGKMDRFVSFVIGVNGKIIHVTDSPDPAAHVKELANALAQLKGKTAP